MTDSGADAGVCGKDITLKNNGMGIGAPNHTHSVTIPAADLAGNANKTYTIAGGHTHSLAITAAQFAMLRAGQTVNITSGQGNGHTHPCTVKCA